jgi:hypothetical protein
MGELSGPEFVNALRTAVADYLNAVDRWEAAYLKYYRLPGHQWSISSDMRSEQAEYEARRRALELLLPRARQLCLKHRLRNPLPNLLRAKLGHHTPQQRIDSAIGRNERNAVADCLLQLADACSGWASPDNPSALDKQEAPPLAPPARGFHRRGVMLAGIFCGIAALITIGVRRTRSQRDSSSNPGQQARRDAILPGGTARFYRIDQRPLTRWGDYGDILQHGMTAHLARTRGRLSLERTGPYMPPITFPGIGDVVLTSPGRKLLETSGLSGFSFQPVNKTRIVDLPWQQWDLTKDEPPQYPTSGEPEDYILERPADSRVAKQMGEIWEMVVPVTARIGRPRPNVESFRELFVELDSWNGADIFRGDGYGSPLVTHAAKVWFEQHFGEYMEFEEFASK